MLRYEKWWTHHIDYEQLVKFFWEENSIIEPILSLHNMSKLMYKLHKWGNSKVGNFDQKIHNLTDGIHKAIMKTKRLLESQLRIDLLKVLKDEEAF